MQVNAPEAIPLHMSRDGPVEMDASAGSAAALETDAGQLVPMRMTDDGPIPMEMEQVRIVEMETQAYKGPTVATPRVGAEVILPTKGYKLLKDVTVREVQVSAVHAPTGGLVYQIE